MYLAEDTLDDLLRGVLTELVGISDVVTSSKGGHREEIGALLELRDPRARLSRTEAKGTLFSCLGELIWYISGSDELEAIGYYIDRYNHDYAGQKAVYTAYGPRLFRKSRTVERFPDLLRFLMRKNHTIDQVENVLRLLRERPSSRQAVIQIFDASDLGRKEVPCTCTLQFFIREGRLDLFTSMRSNDAFLGLAHDIFAFTMIQEAFANALEVKLGTYKHSVGSLHLYEVHYEKAQAFLEEGWQPKIPMPRMPSGDPFASLRILSRAEADIRLGRGVDVGRLGLADYWQDLVRLLQIYRFSRDGDVAGVGRVKGEIASSIYEPYIEKREVTAETKRARNATHPSC